MAGPILPFISATVKLVFTTESLWQLFCSRCRFITRVILSANSFLHPAQEVILIICIHFYLGAGSLQWQNTNCWKESREKKKQKKTIAFTSTQLLRFYCIAWQLNTKDFPFEIRGGFLFQGIKQLHGWPQTHAHILKFHARRNINEYKWICCVLYFLYAWYMYPRV